MSTGHHPHGRFGEGEGQAVPTAAAAAAAAASTARTGTAAPDFDEVGKRSGSPQKAGGQCSVRSVQNMLVLVRKRV